jgi:chromate transporter
LAFKTIDKKDMNEAQNQSVIKTPKLSELAFVFGKMGTTAFGGPAAHIAMMEEEVVRRRQWLSKEEFLDMLGATHLIPGPNSTEMAIHIGHKMAGWRGLFVAGSTFIVPAFLIVWAIAWFYVKYGSLPAIQSLFLGVKPVILAVIGQAIWSLSRTAVKDRILAVLAALALALYLVWSNEIIILFLIALLNLIVRQKLRPPQSKSLWLALLSTVFFSPLLKLNAQIMDSSKAGVEHLFWYFAKVGSVLFGSGYVLIAFLQSDLVDKHQWISQQQLVDAITVGQFTPGPVFTTATFIGYLISGNQGAVLATIGIFAPAFFFVAVSAPFLPALRKSRWTAPILDGLNVASLSLMAGAALILAKDTIGSIYGILIFALSLVLLIKFKINSAWLILGASLLGYFGFAN